MAEIISLHGTTPAEIFQSGLDNVADTEAVSLSVLWKDGRVSAGWSNTVVGRGYSKMFLSVINTFALPRGLHIAVTFEMTAKNTF